MDECRELLVAWLNNAYAMEQSIIKTLEAHAEDAADYPEIKSKIDSHIEQTKNQADRLEDAIEDLGGDVSSVKSTGAKAMGYLQGALSNLGDDRIVKNAIMEHATEHFEMATYQSIKTLALRCGEDDVADLADEIMQEEMRMGEKLKEHLPEIVEMYADERLGEEE